MAYTTEEFLDLERCKGVGALVRCVRDANTDVDWWNELGIIVGNHVRRHKDDPKQIWQTFTVMWTNGRLAAFDSYDVQLVERAI